MNELEIVVDEQQVQQNLTTDETVVLNGEDLSTLNDQEKEGRLSALSKSVSRTAINQLKQMVPTDLELAEVTLNIKISGKAFGMEVAGTGSVKMKPRETN